MDGKDRTPELDQLEQRLADLVNQVENNSAPASSDAQREYKTLYDEALRTQPKIGAYCCVDRIRAIKPTRPTVSSEVRRCAEEFLEAVREMRAARP